MIPDFVKERERNGEGFDLYFAGMQAAICEEWMLQHRVCRLQSPVYNKANIKRWCEEAQGAKLFIDSGAYTALTKGKEVDVDNYIDYINSISEKIHVFAQVDYIPKNKYDETDTAEASWQNYLYMLDRVQDPDKLIPIYHQGENLSALKRMVEFKKSNGEYIDYIGFGALAGTSITVSQKYAFFDRCFRVILTSKNPQVKVHAMGMTSLSLLEMFPFYSADSTSWIMSGAMGRILTPWGWLDVSDNCKFEKGNVQNSTGDVKDMIQNWLISEGLSLDGVICNYKDRMLCNLIMLHRWSKNYRYKGGDLVFHKQLF